MLDFLKIAVKPGRDSVEIYPKFYIKKSSDLMIRGGDFLAVWVEDKGMWSTDEHDVVRLVDDELRNFVNKHKAEYADSRIQVRYMVDSTSGSIDQWHKYCQKQLRDNYKSLDEKIIFQNDPVRKEDYSTKRLLYPMKEGSYDAWDQMVGHLYSPEERHKIEWIIGSIVTGASKSLQKFMVLYGSQGTGKSTIIKVIRKMFTPYCGTFKSKALCSANSQFALESLKGNPLIALEDDGDLSKIEDNTQLNSLVSHEPLTVNEKHKSIYTHSFKAILIIGTNTPVKITNAKSGLLRRLIDVQPTGNRFPIAKYNELFNRIDFELGAIAYHCKQVFEADPHFYDDYVPEDMLGATNDFYNYILESAMVFEEQNGTSLKAAWEMYNQYNSEAKVLYPYNRRVFKEELKNYFDSYEDRYTFPDGTRIRSYYQGFKTTMIEKKPKEVKTLNSKKLLELNSSKSLFDDIFRECPAQYATLGETPFKGWDEVNTTLSDIDTHKLHYVNLPEEYIVIDFDLKDSEGNKNVDRNLEEAAKWPPTYAELSKGGGVHLHYLYSGDTSQLSTMFDTDIEVKIFSGKQSLRRKLTKCNDIPIAELSSGLPLKEKKMLNATTLENEKHLRSLIKKALRKKIEPFHTGPLVEFIKAKLDEAYSSGMQYDVRDMYTSVLGFAGKSTHQASKCMKKLEQMHFCSKDFEEPDRYPDIPFGKEAPMVMFDCEVFPNLFLVNWKLYKHPGHMVRLINPTPAEIENLLNFRLIGFNCRKYDNHMLYARLNGYSNKQLYNLSQRIVSGDRNAFFGEAYNLSYTDIYDFASSANKKSLKKLEVEMGIHHKELGLPWDQPVPEEKWAEVAEYCDNDVIATEAAFDYLKADFTAREILAEITGMTVNTTTNNLTTRFIFGMDKHPQDEFQYRDLSKPVSYLTPDMLEFLQKACPEMMAQKHGEAKSLLPYFPGYKFENGVSTYRDFNPDNPNPLFRRVGEGGNVYSEPGIYTNVGLYDIGSQHPHSIIAEYLFGSYTELFRDLVQARILIKHENWEEASKMMGGKLIPYIEAVKEGRMTSKDLANALKTAINSVYGLTSAKFDNKFRDERNVDNIVAKRGALFMIDLRLAVQSEGYQVVHVKTDSIKVANADDYIEKFIFEFGKRYGYTFEHEATYEKMCLVNKSVYIAKYSNDAINGSHAGEWTATGDQFKVPYIFKQMFSHEPLVFDDFCVVNAVQTALYLDDNESLPEGQHKYQFVGKVGQFCPVKPGVGGCELLRWKDGEGENMTFSSANGAKGYRWLEADSVRGRLEEQVDHSYFRTLVDDAKAAISKYGDYEQFVS